MDYEQSKRRGVIVWVYTLRQVKNLKRYGYIHYVSNKLKYVLLYMNDEEVESAVDRLSSLHFVRKIEISYRPDIDMTFSNALPGKKTGSSNHEFETNYYNEKTYSF